MKKITLFFSVLFVLTPSIKAQPTLWGMTVNSPGGFGTISSAVTGSSIMTTQYTFGFTSPGAEPLYEQLVQASNGKFYGLTWAGGANSCGVLYEYDPVTFIYTKKMDFGGANGTNPTGNLIQATNGKLYGMTSGGGANSNGILFEFDPSTGIFTKKIDFSNTVSGSNPYGGLIQATNGKLYGTTAYGGTNSNGTLFSFDITTGVLTKHVDFNGTLLGAVPYGSLKQASNGFIYGVTTSGGTSGNGTLFQFDIVTNSIVKKFNFNGSASTAKGSLPYGALVEAPNGKLYGMAKNGGVNTFGTLFEYNPANDSCLKKLDFNGGNGKWPLGSLYMASSGLIYGMTWQGGATNRGVLFEYNPAANTYSVKYSFVSATGDLPYGGVTMGTNGKLYGVTSTGGLKNKGVIFEYDLTLSTYIKKIDLNANKLGGNPFGAILLANNNKMYGMTTYGGEYGLGVLYEYDYSTSTYTKKLDFDGSNNGNQPQGDLIQASNNLLYGLAGGGANSAGVLFEYNISTSTYTKKIDFVSINGAYPNGSLLQATNGKLYGMTLQGGTNSIGVLFEYNIATNTYTKLVDFNGAVNGKWGYGGVIQASNGKLYGMTGAGGTNDFGTIFEYNIATNTFTKKLDFNGAGNGKTPYGDLVEAGNGKLYGLTYTGGVNNHGVLFEFDPSNGVYAKKLDFNNSVTGGFPTGRMTLASNGKLYGSTEGGGLSNTGVLFEFDPNTSVYTKLIDLTGNAPLGDLIEFCQNPSAAGTITGTTAICSGPGATVSLVTTTVSGATSYTWALPATASISAGATSNSITIDFSSTAAGIYSITTAGSNTCGAGTASQLVFTVNATPTLGINSGSICNGQSFTLQASGANSYTLQGAQTVVSPNTTTSYSLTGESAEGCIAANIVNATVTVNALPTLTATANASMICVGQSATLSVSGANTYTWSNAAQGNTVAVTPATTTIYTVTGTDANGCEDTTQITQVVSLCTDVAEQINSDNYINVFPNPTSGKIMIEAQNEIIIEIYNAIGELVGKEIMNEKVLEVDLRDHAKGLYYFKAKGENNTKVFKVLYN